MMQAITFTLLIVSTMGTSTTPGLGELECLARVMGAQAEVAAMPGAEFRLARCVRETQKKD